MCQVEVRTSNHKEKEFHQKKLQRKYILIFPELVKVWGVVKKVQFKISLYQKKKKMKILAQKIRVGEFSLYII